MGMQRTTPDAVVIGNGPVGATITERLLAAGHAVRVITRSGSGPAAAERVRADAMDAAATAAAVGDVARVFMCFHATYSAKVWSRTLPVMEASVTTHARASGASVVTAESLYAFRADATPITAATPLQPRSRKGDMRRGLLKGRAASGARVVSVVAGDFYGPRVLTSMAGDRLVKPVLTGGVVRPIGDVDLPHAFTHVPDLAAAMIAASTTIGAGHELLMAPNAGSLTMRQLIETTATAAGVPVPQISPMGVGMVATLGLVVPILREIHEVAYQFTQPFEVDASADAARLGVAATPWEDAAAQTVAWWRAGDLLATR